DVAAGQREGVDGGVVDDGEVPGQVGALGARGELAAESLDVALQLAVVVKTELLHHLLVVLTAESDLLVLAVEVELFVASRGVGGASDYHHQGGKRQPRGRGAKG